MRHEFYPYCVRCTAERIERNEPRRRRLPRNTLCRECAAAYQRERREKAKALASETKTPHQDGEATFAGEISGAEWRAAVERKVQELLALVASQPRRRYTRR
jgi:hypothetical protein